MESQRIDSARRGDDGAFAELVEGHYRAVYGVAFSAVGDWCAAEDIAQETFLVAWANLAKLRRSSAFGAWVRRIARNLSKNWRRSMGYRRKLEERQRQLASGGEAVAAPAPQRLDEADRRAEVWDALRSLSPKLREVVVMFYLEGQSVAEVAGALDLSESAVKKRLQYARPKLREYFEACWQAEMEQERRRLKPGNAASRFLAGCVLGPVDLALGAAASKPGLGLWAHSLGKDTALTFAKGVVAVESKKIIIAVIVLVVIAFGTYRIATMPDGEQTTSVPEKIEIQVADEEDPVPETSPSFPAKSVEEQNAVGGAQETTVISKADQLIDSSEKQSKKKFVMEPEKIEDPEDYVRLFGWVHDMESRPVPGSSLTVLATGLHHPGYGGDVDDGLKLAYRDAFDLAMTDKDRTYTVPCDAEGGFVVEGIEYAGVYLIEPSAPGYYPEMRRTIAPAIGGQPGRPPREPIVLRLKQGVTLSGRLLSVQGAAVTDAILQIRGITSGRSMSTGRRAGRAPTDQSGGFQLVAPWEGLLTIEAISASLGEATFTDVPVEPGAYAELRYPADASVYGAIQWQDGRPASRCAVVLKGLMVQVMYNELGEVSGWGTSSAITGIHKDTVNAEGDFRIDDVDPGQTYTVDILDPDGDALCRDLVLGTVEAGQELRWDYVIGDSIIVRGTLRGAFNGQPLPGMRIVASKQGIDVPGVSQTERGTTSEDGSFEITLLSGPGTYKITPQYMHHGGSYGSGPEHAYAQTVELRAGEEKQVDLLLDEPWSCSFLLVDNSGLALPSVRVQVDERWQNTRISGGNLETDAQGRLRLDGLTPGAEISCSFSRQDYAEAQSVPYVGEPGEELAEQVVVMYESAGLEGVLVDESGQPIANKKAKFTLYYGQDGDEKKLNATTDSYGTFYFSKEIPATIVVVQIEVTIKKDGEKESLIHTTEQIEFLPGQITNLGAITLSKGA